MRKVYIYLNHRSKDMVTSLLDKIKPKDIIALVTLIGALILFAMKYDGYIQTVMTIILTYYFVKRTNGKDSGK